MEVKHTALRKVTDLDTKRSGLWMFIEAQCPEALSAVSSFSIEDGFITAKHESYKILKSIAKSRL